MSRWHWILNRLGKRLWLRATLIGLLGVAAAIFAALVERHIPWDLPTNIGADAVGTILNIIASSMLAVTTFSLSVMTAAFGAATTNVTPRATRLLMEDSVTQTVLSTFIGAFLFGIVGIVVLSTGAYGERGRFVLFVITIGVIVLIVASLLRWIDHLTRLGRVGETTARVEQAAQQSIVDRLGAPYLGGRRSQDLPPNGYPIKAAEIGYVQHIDVGALQVIAEETDQDIYVAALPGTFIYTDTPVAWLAEAPAGKQNPEIQEKLLKAITIGNERNFDQDPRFALSVLSEIGSRALSPATNDPGTAIDVIGRMTRLMSLWTASSEFSRIEPIYPRVHVPALRCADLFEDAFMLMGRDGAGLIEVQLRLQKSLLALGRLGDNEYNAAAMAMAHEARDRANAALTLEADRARLLALYAPAG